MVELTDSNGAVLKDYVYDAFGVEVNPDDNDNNPFRYCGEYYDKETGSIYLRNRYYSPSTGRFTSEDPIKSGLNWYTYCNGNPILFKDPLGLMTEGDIKGVMTRFEEGEMAPMAYSYSFELIYDWYLTDDKKGKDSIDKLFYTFRDTGYTTTNGANKSVDEGIAYMPKKPSGNLSQEVHYFRNKLNLDFTWSEYQKLSKGLPDFLRWDDSVIASYHQNNKDIVDGKKYNNLKIVSSDGYFELVYSGYHHTLLTEANNSLDMGTYNYANPTNDMWGHYWLDVAPYNMFKNTENDYIFFKAISAGP